MFPSLHTSLPMFAELHDIFQFLHVETNLQDSRERPHEMIDQSCHQYPVVTLGNLRMAGTRQEDSCPKRDQLGTNSSIPAAPDKHGELTCLSRKIPWWDLKQEESNQYTCPVWRTPPPPRLFQRFLATLSILEGALRKENSLFTPFLIIFTSW